MSRLQIPIRLIALFLMLVTGCQQDFTAEVTILGIGPTIEKLQVYMWRDRRRSNDAPQEIKPEQASFKIRVPINEFTKRIELAVLGMEADSELKSHGYAQFDLEAGTDSSTISVELVDARRAQLADEYACPNPIESGLAECDSPLIHTAEDGAYWELRSHTLTRTLDTKRWNVWEDHTDNRLRALDSLGANYAVASGDNGTIIECIGNQCNRLQGPTNKALRSVRARNADERVLRAVGEKGTIVNCAKGGCSLMDSKTTENLNGAMFSSEGILRAVGDHGTLLRCEETQCFSFQVGFDVTLRAIFGNDPSLYWIVGDGGLVLKCSDDNRIANCKKIGTPTANNLADVWGSDIDTVVVVGDKGTILTCRDSGCTAVPDIGTTRDLKHIHGSDPDNIIVSGADKTTILSNGREWRKVERKPPPSVLTALTVSTGNLNPAFSPTTETYTLTVPRWTGSIQLTATATAPNVTIQVNRKDIPSGVTSGPIPLGTGVTMISVAVRAPGTTDRVYGIAVIRSGSDYLKASNTAKDAAFGSRMSLSGDTLAVGAPLESSNATGVDGDQTNTKAAESGAVYVFVRSGGAWTQQAYLKASNTEAGDHFGHSVSLSGDTLAVGAVFEGSNSKGVNGDQSNNFALNSGAVYVFSRSGGVWTQQAYLKASNTDLPDFFGTTVALSGDTLAVGAMEEDSSARGVNGDQSDNSAFASGAVYVFVRSGGVWTQQAYLKASNTATNDFFGASVALSGDTLAIGAFGEDSTAKGVNGNQAERHASTANSGAVYVFVRSGGVWTQQAYLKASNTDVSDFFGTCVSLSGDTLAIGAVNEGSTAKGVNGDQSNNDAAGSGAVYVFVRTAGVWTQQAYLKASNSQAKDQFGHSVSLSGDTLAIGAVREDSTAKGVNGDQSNNDAVGSGAIYVFVRSGGVWTQQAYLKASNTAEGDGFGSSVSLSGGTLAVGAAGEDSIATGVNGSQAERYASTANSGAVYIF